MIDCLRLMLVTHQQNQSFEQYRHLIEEAVYGGVTSVQLRAKNLDSHALLLLAKQYKTLLDALHVPLIINDHVDIAKTIDAAGVHIGQADISVQAARCILGPDKLLGLSIDTHEQLLAANELSEVDYIGVTVFQSPTKKDCNTIWGIHGLQEVVQLSKHPVIGIGGIDVINAQQVIKAGAAGIAVISAIHQHPSPRQAASELCQHSWKKL